MYACASHSLNFFHCQLSGLCRLAVDTDCITLCRAVHGGNLPYMCTLCNVHRPLLFIDMSTLETNPTNVLGTSLTNTLENYVNLVLGEWIMTA